MPRPPATSAPEGRPALQAGRVMKGQAEWSFRPWVIALIAAIMGLSVVAVTGIVWFRLADESRATFTTFQRVTLLVFFGAVLWILYRLGSVSVHAYPDELRIRNLFHSYRYEWKDISALRFRAGDPWLQLFDAEGNRLGVMAIQSAEGARAVRAARRLAAIARSHGAGN